MTVDVTRNRAMRKWSRREQLARVLWAFARHGFALVPRPLWSVRRAMLRVFGAQVGTNVHVHPSARITMPWNLTLGDGCAIGDRAIIYALGPITVAARATISQGAHLCAGSHDWRDPAMPLLKFPIMVGSDAWICADAFVGPGVRVGSRAIVGARAVVMKDVDEGVIMVGNPAQVVASRTTIVAAEFNSDSASSNRASGGSRLRDDPK
jgi:putative colanic acid biosynthesis acetyltransferase WcaF